MGISDRLVDRELNRLQFRRGRQMESCWATSPHIRSNRLKGRVEGRSALGHWAVPGACGLAGASFAFRCALKPGQRGAGR
jgi:hypothetical protein